MITVNMIMHPEDQKAIRVLKNIPYIEKICRSILKMAFEKLYKGENLAMMVKVDETYMPELHEDLLSVANAIGIQAPELYIYNDPVMNAFTFGETNPYVCVSSSLIEKMNREERKAIIAHECGHILCRHVVYNMVAQYVRLGLDYIGLIGKLAKPVQIALDYWSRKSELSCDRCGSIVTSPETVARVMARLAGGPKSLTSKLDMKLWAAQADKYDEIRNGNLWDKSLQIASVLNRTHPFSAVRVREILKWGDSAQYKNLMQNLNAQKSGKKCPKCGKTVDENWAFCMYCGEKL